MRKLAGRLSRDLLLDLGKAKSAAVTLILSGDCSDPRLLFIKRKVRRGDPWSGQIAFPGGRKKVYEKNLLETAIRETYEEVGVRLSEENFVGLLGLFSPRNAPEIRVAAYVAYLERTPEIRISEREVEDYFWIPLRDMPRCEAVKTLRTGRGLWSGVTYQCEKGLIWGMTARITKKLLTLYEFQDIR